MEGDIDAQQFCLAFDSLLQEQNIEYESKRKSGRLGFPTFEFLPSHFYTQYRQKRVEQGASNAQVKDLILCDEETWKQYISN